MADFNKEKAAAAAKMAFGIARIGSGVATGLGLGIVGGALKQRHLMPTAMRLGKMSIQGGKRMFDEGRRDWERANS